MEQRQIPPSFLSFCPPHRTTASLCSGQRTLTQWGSIPPAGVPPEIVFCCLPACLTEGESPGEMSLFCDVCGPALFVLTHQLFNLHTDEVSPCA